MSTPRASRLNRSVIPATAGHSGDTLRLALEVTDGPAWAPTGRSSNGTSGERSKLPEGPFYGPPKGTLQSHWKIVIRVYVGDPGKGRDEDD